MTAQILPFPLREYSVIALTEAAPHGIPQPTVRAVDFKRASEQAIRDAIALYKGDLVGVSIAPIEPGKGPLLHPPQQQGDPC